MFHATCTATILERYNTKDCDNTLNLKGTFQIGNTRNTFTLRKYRLIAKLMTLIALSVISCMQRAFK
jgi:hypothetical protein